MHRRRLQSCCLLLQSGCLLLLPIAERWPVAAAHCCRAVACCCCPLLQSGCRSLLPIAAERLPVAAAHCCRTAVHFCRAAVTVPEAALTWCPSLCRIAELELLRGHERSDHDKLDRLEACTQSLVKGLQLERDKVFIVMSCLHLSSGAEQCLRHWNCQSLDINNVSLAAIPCSYCHLAAAYSILFPVTCPCL